MKKNVGNADKVVRILLAVAVAILYYTGVISGTLAIILGILAVAWILTSLMSFCPFYLPFKISTTKKESK